MKLYILMNRKTGEIVRDKAYVNIRDAKLALKYHYGRKTQEYGIGVVERTAELAWYIDEAGNWAEVGE